MTDYQYQVGGCLTIESPTYVWRPADEELYQGLKTREYCYVLNSRQMGKSSLRVRTMQRLQAEGVACAAIDLTRIGSQQVTSEQWYAGIVRSLWSSFELTEKVNIRSWWREHDELSEVYRISEFLEKVLLQEIQKNIVIFVDEIDSVLSLEFNVDDFFKLIRFCYNERANQSIYNRLTFVLLGVASPSDLVYLLGFSPSSNRQNKNLSTPYNIGSPIELTGFSWRNMKPLCPGIEHQSNQPEAILREVFKWTKGQPFLTQKIFKLIQSHEKSIPSGEETKFVNYLVQNRILKNWISQDEPQHLRTIRDRLLLSNHSEKLLRLYEKIIRTGEIEFQNTPEQLELRLTGLVVPQDGKLKVFNRIYAEIFNEAWLNQALETVSPQIVDVPQKIAASTLINISTTQRTNNINLAYAEVSLSRSQTDRPNSECGIDYTELQHLLATQQWKAADLATRRLMLAAVNRKNTDGFRAEDFRHFPRTDLLTIDRLWSQSSNGRFGFSVQARIWQDVRQGGGSDYQIKYGFGDRLQWRTDGFWKSYPSLNFTSDAAEGHLPVAWTGLSSAGSRLVGLGIFFDRVEACQKNPANLSNLATDVIIPQTVNYTRLRQLLAAGQWQEADRETKRILLELVGRTTENPFRLEDLGSLTAGDLHILDRLWSEYSDGHFGYSIQQQIWQNLASDRSTPQRIEHFLQRIGWNDGRHLRSWHRLFFSLRSPAGHLPSLVAPIASTVSPRLLLSTFLGRWEYCQNQQREAAATLTRFPNFVGSSDYTSLKYLLIEQQWQAAEAETTALLLKIAACPTPKQLSAEAIDRLSCEALLAIDRIWVRATQSHCWIWLSFRNQPHHILGTLLPALSSKLSNCYLLNNLAISQ
jgi:GUN4-like/AAA-like domain